jgi:uroporphyrinogen-III decarboxylase
MKNKPAPSTTPSTVEMNTRTRIRHWVDQLEEAVNSPRNQARGKVYPQVSFNLEEPMASARIFDYDANDYYSNPAFFVEQSLRQKLWRWENFPEDELRLTMDVPVGLSYYPEYTFLGMNVEFTREGVPLIQTDHPLTRQADLHLLKPVDFYTSGWMPRILRWWDEVRAVADERLKPFFNMTWWRGPLDLAMQLRGYENFLSDTLDRPQFLHDLMSFLTEQRCRWYEGYYRHFNLPVSAGAIGDDWINVPLISPGIFRDFVLPSYLEIERYHGKLAGLHSCGNQTPVQRYLLELKTLDGLEISPWSDLEKSLQNIPPEKYLSVAIKPNDVLFASPAEMETQLRHIVGACTGRYYDIGTSGLTPILASTQAYIDQINTWIGIARRVVQPKSLRR